ncbi:MAG: hypothetical protein M1821_006597 [Bathelium mastoideum]|nr:MAG: hypothetical protein M1821_006597 [Bathelium mastoideum]
MYTYSWNGKEKRFDDNLPYIVQAYLAWLDDEAIRNRVYMRQTRGKISGFTDKTSMSRSKRNFHFDMETCYENGGETFYNIQLQGRANPSSKSVSKGKTGKSTDSFCDVHISKDATPSPEVFRTACWSSAERCNENNEGRRTTKTMKVVIRKDNTWINEETGETGFDEASREEGESMRSASTAEKKRALLDRQEKGELVPQWEWDNAHDESSHM